MTLALQGWQRAREAVDVDGRPDAALLSQSRCSCCGCLGPAAPPPRLRRTPRPLASVSFCRRSCDEASLVLATPDLRRSHPLKRKKRLVSLCPCFRIRNCLHSRTEVRRKRRLTLTGPHRPRHLRYPYYYYHHHYRTLLLLLLSPSHLRSLVLLLLLRGSLWRESVTQCAARHLSARRQRVLAAARLPLGRLSLARSLARRRHFRCPRRTELRPRNVD